MAHPENSSNQIKGRDGTDGIGVSVVEPVRRANEFACYFAVKKWCCWDSVSHWPPQAGTSGHGGWSAPIAGRWLEIAVSGNGRAPMEDDIREGVFSCWAGKIARKSGDG
jgi:hypothetical protein